LFFTDLNSFGEVRRVGGDAAPGVERLFSEQLLRRALIQNVVLLARVGRQVVGFLAAFGKVIYSGLIYSGSDRCR